MAKNDTENTNTGDEGAAPETPAVDVAALEAAVKTAQTELDALTPEFAAAAGDLTKMLDISARMQAAKRNLEKAENAFKAGTFELRAAERMEFSVGLKEQLETFIAPFEAKARELSLTSVHVTFGSEGGIAISITNSAAPVGQRKVRTPSAGGTTADGKNRGLWTHPNGNTYSSRELIETFGDEAMGEGWAAKVLDRADNWKEPRWGPNGNEPMKAGPGFNGPLNALAEKIGAKR